MRGSLVPTDSDQMGFEILENPQKSEEMQIQHQISQISQELKNTECVFEENSFAPKDLQGRVENSQIFDALDGT